MKCRLCPTIKNPMLTTKMLLFGNTFCPQNTPRKSVSVLNLHTLDWSTREIELGLEYGAPVMNIGGHSLTFEDGQWISEGNVSGKEAIINNLSEQVTDSLFLKLSETTAEYHLMEKQLEKMKILSRRKK
uniref:Chibby 1, beta catenin antagonist n=1 Tax=Oncorhynchus tshawytscha TaxID=74940 RepID=A0A8C8GFX4_ONCTS